MWVGGADRLCSISTVCHFAHCVGRGGDNTLSFARCVGGGRGSCIVSFTTKGETANLFTYDVIFTGLTPFGMQTDPVCYLICSQMDTCPSYTPPREPAYAYIRESSFLVRYFPPLSSPQAPLTLTSQCTTFF